MQRAGGRRVCAERWLELICRSLGDRQVTLTERQREHMTWFLDLDWLKLATLIIRSRVHAWVAPEKRNWRRCVLEWKFPELVL